MRVRAATSLMVTALCAGGWIVAPPPASATVLDRIAASVGSHVITQSDLIQYLRVSAFLDQKPVILSGEEKLKAANHLVDQYLILSDAERNHVTLPAEADARSLLDRTKALFGSEADYRAALQKYGITEQDVSSQLLAGLQTLRYSDFRFRPEVQLSDQEMRDYFDKLMKGPGSTSASTGGSFAENRERVQTLMTDQRVMQALDQWLTVVREENHVRFWDAAFQ